MPAPNPAAPAVLLALANDPALREGGQWNMLGDRALGGLAARNPFGSQAVEAWAAGRLGAPGVVVALPDTGVDYTHPDLHRNIWLNQGEIPAALRPLLADPDGDGLVTFRDLNDARNAAFVADRNGNGRIDAGDLLRDPRWANGRDEEGNGHRDDLIGWDFVNNDNDPFDEHGHGTHVAGVLGAAGQDGFGVAGVAWSVQIAPLRFLGANGAGSAFHAMLALDYATAAAARAAPGERFLGASNSWVAGAPWQPLLDAIDRGAERGLLFVMAAGNQGRDLDLAPAGLPAAHGTAGAAGRDAVLAVAALTAAGALAGYSNFGATSVDLAAPGSTILSTLPGGGHGVMSGTSMAVPHVTGAAALYAAARPEATAAEIRAAILAGAAPTPGLEGLVATGGRLDIGAVSDALPPRLLPTPSILRVEQAEGAPRLLGTLPTPLLPGEVVAVLRDGRRLGEAAVEEGGVAWSFAEPSSPGPGAHAYAARVEAASGAVGAASPRFEVRIAPATLFGTAAGETLVGTEAGEILSGAPLSDPSPGRGTVDRLAGGPGPDVFVLGDGRGVFYDDGLARSLGAGDYAQILDFATGEDRLQLAAGIPHHALPLRLGGLPGLGVFADLNANGRLDPQDELVAHLVGAETLRAEDWFLT